MKKGYFRYSISPAILIFLLVFSTVAFVIPLAQADRDGIGKYVNVKVSGEGGSVILTKVSSGEFWQIDVGDTFNEKLGAGLVSVEVSPNVGEDFVVNWLIYEFDESGNKIIRDKINGANYIEFRTIKGITYVEATFIEVCTITAKVFEDENADNGEIIYNGNSYSDLSIIVEKNTWLTLEFDSDIGSHISAITLNGVYSPLDILDEGRYFNFEVDKDYDIVVYFSPDGFAWVPEGNDITVYFAEGVSLHFTTVTGGNLASGTELDRPETWGAFIWDISTLEILYDGVTITLELAGHLVITEVLVIVPNEAFYCDVDGDLSVTAADLSLVANYNKATETNPNNFPYDPIYDTNRDGAITQDDVHRVNEYKGTNIDYEILPESQWTISYDGDFTIVTITPEHFSIFRGR